MYAQTSKPFSLASQDSWQEVSRPPEYARTRRGFDGSGSRKDVLLNFGAVDAERAFRRTGPSSRRHAVCRNIIIFQIINVHTPYLVQ